MRHKLKTYAFVCPTCRHCDIVAQDFRDHLKTHGAGIPAAQAFEFCQPFAGFRRLWRCSETAADGQRCNYMSVTPLGIETHKQFDHGMSAEEASFRKRPRPVPPQQQPQMSAPRRQAAAPAQQTRVTPQQKRAFSQSTSPPSPGPRMQPPAYAPCQGSKTSDEEAIKQRSWNATAIVHYKPDAAAVCSMHFSHMPHFGIYNVRNDTGRVFATFLVTPHASDPDADGLRDRYPAHEELKHSGTIVNTRTRPHSLAGRIVFKDALPRGKFTANPITNAKDSIDVLLTAPQM